MTGRERVELPCCGIRVWPEANPLRLNHKDGCPVPKTARYRAVEESLKGSDTSVVVYGVAVAADIYEPILAEVLSYIAASGWARGKLDGHARRDGTDLDTLEPVVECRCGHLWPCPIVAAYEALGA